MKKTTKKTEVGTIDCTPTWVGLMPILVSATARGDKGATEELTRALRMADEMTTLGNPKLLRKAGADAVALLESTDRGRRVLDAVQRLLRPSGYGLDLPGLQALVTVFRCVASGLFEGVVQGTASERRVASEAAALPSLRFVIRDMDTGEYLDQWDERDSKWCESRAGCMRMPLHQAVTIGDIIRKRGGAVETMLAD